MGELQRFGHLSYSLAKPILLDLGSQCNRYGFAENRSHECSWRSEPCLAPQHPEHEATAK